MRRRGAIGRRAAAAASAALAALAAAALLAWPAAAQFDEFEDEEQSAARALADSLAAAREDSIMAATGGLGSELLEAMQRAAAEGSQGLILSWVRDPQVGVRAEVSRVRWYGELRNALLLRGSNNLSANLNYSTESYRKQDKTVERRDGNLTYIDPQGRWFSTSLRMTNNWSEDRTVNTAGIANVNKRDFKQASVDLDSLGTRTGPVRHAVRLSGSLDDQRGASLGQRNNFSESNLNAALRSRYSPVPGLRISSTIYSGANSGRRSLGEETNPSSASQDSLAGRAGVTLGGYDGFLSIRRGSLSKKYLDYRRNANGLVDTVGVSEKIVQELETNEALSYELRQQYRHRRFRLAANLGRDVEENSFRASNAGFRERLQDRVDLSAGARVGADSLRVSYVYGWRWDDQVFRGATAARGRQYTKRRDFTFEWRRRLFKNTEWNFNWTTGLQQDIAERQFNENDRDRYESSFVARLTSDLPGGFKPTMTFSARHIEDVAIRSSRSANNSVRETYEVVPSYSWPIAGWLRLQQDFRVSIEYTDYLYSGLAGVSVSDNYNKRGNLNTRVTIRPNQRLTLSVRHDYNARFNATRVFTDASGNDFYSRDLEQRISTIDFGLAYKINDSFKIEGASDRTKDIKDTFGRRVTTTDLRSGKVWLGGTFNKKWSGGGRELKAAVRKYNAYGPNVQRTNADYWDADVSLNWRF